VIVALAGIGRHSFGLRIAIVRRLSAAVAELYSLVVVECVLGNVFDRAVDRG
jgi:hypothetical protein